MNIKVPHAHHLHCHARSQAHQPSHLEATLRVHERLRDARIRLELLRAGYESRPGRAVESELDESRITAATVLASQEGSSLRQVVQLLRGESEADPRPNKALRPTDYRWLLSGYQQADFMISSASSGLRPTWTRAFPQQEVRSKNHLSAIWYAKSVERSIRAGQDAGQYLVVDSSVLEKWSDVQISPLGAVEKAGVDPEHEIRLIHGLKRPLGASTNEATDWTDLPTLTYRHVAHLARRIEWLHKKSPGTPIKMMKGDVKEAFRHLMLHWDSVRWTSSPTYYGAYGGAITWLVQRESPASLDLDDTDTECFYAYEWVDDHVLIEHDVGSRLRLAEAALRTAMMAIFGPRAMNEKKFSDWCGKLEVLGLEFDLVNRTVSMPQRKLDKACARVDALLNKARVHRTDLLKLLGSLRHMCTCCRAAKPFFQRVQALASSAPPYGTVRVTDAVLEDLRWSKALLRLGQFQHLPTTMFQVWPDPDVHIYMDASNEGLAVLDPATRCYIQLRFDEAERALIADPSQANDFTINVREQLCIALAAVVWGPQWRPRFSASVGQVWCWSDNTTAVAVTNKLASRNEFAQTLNGHVGLMEAIHGFRIRGIHLPGKLNTMADAASRAWTQPFTDTWIDLSQGWHETPVPES